MLLLPASWVWIASSCLSIFSSNSPIWAINSSYWILRSSYRVLQWPTGPLASDSSSLLSRMTSGSTLQALRASSFRWRYCSSLVTTSLKHPSSLWILAKYSSFFSLLLEGKLSQVIHLSSFFLNWLQSEARIQLALVKPCWNTSFKLFFSLLAFLLLFSEAFLFSSIFLLSLIFSPFVESRLSWKFVFSFSSWAFLALTHPPLPWNDFLSNFSLFTNCDLFICNCK